MLRGVDQELIPHLLENMQKLGMDGRVDTPFDQISKADNGMLRVQLQDGGYLEAEKVLWALGRSPNLNGLNLQKAGVEVSRNAIKVDSY